MPDARSPLYLDNHATTPLDPRVLEAMLPFLGARFGNPSSRSHVYGRRASDAVERARATVARLIGAKPREIVFTSGATEATHLALVGTLRATGLAHAGLVTQATEHSSVLATAEALTKEGFTSTIVGVDALGRVSPDAIARALTPETRLVSVMLANAEIGTVQPIAELAELCAARGAALHCDAAQGLGLVPLDVSKTPVDLISISAHKMYGPMGVGALYLRDRHDLPFEGVVVGGGQERGLRGGTLNVPGIIGFARAAELLHEEGGREAERIAARRDALREGLLTRIPDTHLHGAWDARHPGNLSLRFEGVRAELLIVETSRTLAFSSGSACASGQSAPSHVLSAIGLSDEDARASFRLGLGRFTRDEDVDLTIDALAEAVARIRARRHG